MNALSPLSCVVFAMIVASVVFAGESPCARCAALLVRRVEQVCPLMTTSSQAGSFVAARTRTIRYTGARVAQYQRLPAIEPLEDERLVTSRYHRTQTNLRGTNGSSETYYEVQAWGNGRGGIDAEWERFHNAWKESYLQGGFYNQQGPGIRQRLPGPIRKRRLRRPRLRIRVSGVWLSRKRLPRHRQRRPVLGKPRRRLERQRAPRQRRPVQRPRPRGRLELMRSNAAHRPTARFQFFCDV